MKQANKQPNISIVIPAYNEEGRLAPLLESLRSQDYTGNIELIVVDNNSTDNTTAVARANGAVVVFEKQPGVARARQAGFMAASGDIILTTDADCLIPENWVSTMVVTFDKNEKTVAVAGMYDFYDSNFMIRRVLSQLIYPMFCVFRWYTGSNLAIKKSAFLAIGGFNTELPLAEDSDIANRLKTIGKVVRVPSLKVKTSGRRFNELGVWAGLWSYAKPYFQIILNKDVTHEDFEAGCEVESLSIFHKFFLNVCSVLFIIALFMTASPAHARNTTRRVSTELREHHLTLNKNRRRRPGIIRSTRKVRYDAKTNSLIV